MPFMYRKYHLTCTAGNTPDGDGIIWIAANECDPIRLDALGIRSTSGVDSRPSGLISVHSTFGSHDRPHRTCWPPLPRCRRTEQPATRRVHVATLYRQPALHPDPRPHEQQPLCSTSRKMPEGSRCSCAVLVTLRPLDKDQPLHGQLDHQCCPSLTACRTPRSDASWETLAR